MNRLVVALLAGALAGSVISGLPAMAAVPAAAASAAGTPDRQPILDQDLNSKQVEEALRDRGRTLALQGLERALSARFALAGRSPEQLAREAVAHEAALAPFERLSKELRAMAALSPAARVAEQSAA